MNNIEADKNIKRKGKRVKIDVDFEGKLSFGERLKMRVASFKFFKDIVWFIFLYQLFSYHQIYLNINIISRIAHYPSRQTYPKPTQMPFQKPGLTLSSRSYQLSEMPPRHQI